MWFCIRVSQEVAVKLPRRTSFISGSTEAEGFASMLSQGAVSKPQFLIGHWVEISAPYYIGLSKGMPHYMASGFPQNKYLRETVIAQDQSHIFYEPHLKSDILNISAVYYCLGEQSWYTVGQSYTEYEQQNAGIVGGHLVGCLQQFLMKRLMY